MVDEIHVAETRFLNPQDVPRAASPPAARARRSTRPNSLDELLALYSQGDMQSLDYVLMRDRDRTILKLVPIEKSWGPDYLRFGLNLETDLRAEAQLQRARAVPQDVAQFAAAANGLWASSRSAASSSSRASSTSPSMRTSSSSCGRSGPTALRKAPLYFDGVRLAEYRINQTNLGIEAGVNLGTAGQAVVSWMQRRSSAYRDTGSPVLPDDHSRVSGISAGIHLDQFDDLYFPTRGYHTEATWFDARRTSESDHGYGKVEAAYAHALSLGRFTLIATLSGGRFSHGASGISDLFSLGGVQRLSVFAPGEILAEEYGMGALRAEYRIKRRVPLFGLTSILGATFERARVKNALTEPNLRGTIDSYGVYVATSTTFGPLYLGYSSTKERRGRWYLFLGTP